MVHDIGVSRVHWSGQVIDRFTKRTTLTEYIFQKGLDVLKVAGEVVVSLTDQV